MSQFRFRLAAPLRVARVRRSELRRSLAEAIRNEALIRQRLDEQQAQLTDARHQLGQRTRAGVTGAELQIETVAFDALGEKVDQLAEQRRKAFAEQTAVRDQLAAMLKELRVLERLEDEARRTHAKEQSDTQQKQLDDLTLVRRNAARESERVVRGSKE